VNPSGIEIPRRQGATILILAAWLASLALAGGAAHANEPDFSPPLPPVAALPQPLEASVPEAVEPPTADAGMAAIEFVLPLKRAEVTSPFGWRVHPVFGDRRFHKGVDFRAPKGTPVWASADGVVVEAGWRGNYGKIVRVRHEAGVETTYSHLSGFARGLHAGKTVRQGQIVGYVGRTGVATGHHLYYEMVVDGKYVDPLAPPPIIAIRLEGHQLTALKGYLGATATFN